MKATDIRNENFESMRGSLERDTLQVYQAWVAYGPATTMQLALASGIPLLNVRPRTSDLMNDCGLVRLVRREGRHGVYEAVEQSAWDEWRTQLFPPDTQLKL